jgi:CMP-N,N'-diacetyllegionaminic acid synthase
MINNFSVLALIPARGGSKGIVGKNILDVGGRPMIGWTIDAAKKSKYIDRVILSSDDPDIIRVARLFDCEVPFVRPSQLSTDDASTVDVVFHALDQIPLYDIVVLLQPTSPLRIAEDIDGCLFQMCAMHAQSSVTVAPAVEHPYLTYHINAEGKMRAYVEPTNTQSLQRQKLPPAWVLNGAVYAFQVKWFVKNRCCVNSDSIAFPMPAERSIDIDTIDELNFANLIINKK